MVPIFYPLNIDSYTAYELLLLLSNLIVKVFPFKRGDCFPHEYHAFLELVVFERLQILLEIGLNEILHGGWWRAQALKDRLRILLGGCYGLNSVQVQIGGFQILD